MKNVRTVEHEFLQARLLLDIVMAAAAMLCAYGLRFYLLDRTGLFPVTKGYQPTDYVFLIGYAMPLTVFSFFCVKLYGLKVPVFNYEIFKRIIRGTLLAISTISTWLLPFLGGSPVRMLYSVAPRR